ncbi:MAG: substrate-binding domain-containing protein, partial [Pseudomonadota bacterium]|nr:substrate-binding domain-containing protein [Pseudomonadota bacterium]
DDALVASGLASRLLRSFSFDVGLPVRLRAGPATAILDAVRDGEVDAVLSNVPAVEEALAARSLVYDRRLVAYGEFVVVGPVPPPRGRNPPPAFGDNVREALGRIRDLATAGQEGAVFMSAGDGSGTHLAEQALWRAAGIAPAASWYLMAPRGEFLAQVRARNAFAVVERAAWLASGGGPRLPVVCAADPMLVEPIHAMRSFRAKHPAGKMFVGWIAGRRGRSVVSALRSSYRAATS